MVFIHGWMSDATSWGRDASGNPSPRPHEGFRFIVVDCRGHGESEKFYEQGRYGAEMAKDIVRLLDHLKVNKAHLVGYSMGAFIAGHVVAHHPQRVLSVIYGGQAPLLRGKDDGGSAEVNAFAKAVEDNRLGDYIQFVTPSSRPKPNDEQAAAQARFMFHGKDVKALAAAGLSFPKLAVDEKALLNASVPTLFLYGSNESDSLKRRVQALQERLPSSKVRELAGADHVTALRHKEFGVSIIEFLESSAKAAK